MSEINFRGRVAIITGAGRGLGRAHALLLASRGAKVVVNDLGSGIDGSGSNPEPAQDVVDEIILHSGEAVANLESVAEAQGAGSLVEMAIKQFGRVDIVINNAGILTTSEFVDTDIDELMRHLSVHLIGTFNVCQAAWPHMVRQGYGRIVATTSASIFGMQPIISYVTAKAGLIGLIRSLAVIGAPSNIKANLIAPLANTRMSGRSRPPGGASRPKASSRPREPDLVSPVVAYLVDESCPVSGEILSAGMGRVARIFTAETVGYTNSNLQPEDVRENWDSVMDEKGYVVPRDYATYSENFLQLIEGK